MGVTKNSEAIWGFWPEQKKQTKSFRSRSTSRGQAKEITDIHEKNNNQHQLDSDNELKRNSRSKTGFGANFLAKGRSVGLVDKALGKGSTWAVSLEFEFEFEFEPLKRKQFSFLTGQMTL